MDGTREDVLRDINLWLQDTEAPNILWIYGSPGAGKSTIASTVVANHKECYARFFFRRDVADLRDADLVWRCIALDLAKGNPGFRKCVVQALEEYMAHLKDMEIDKQYKELIENPLKGLSQTSPSQPLVVVIDALDECESYEKLFMSLKSWAQLRNDFKLIISS